MRDLKAHHHDRLRVLVLGPRSYSINDAACATLLRWGLIQETDRPVQTKPHSPPPHRSYDLTEAGRAFLSTQHSGKL